MEDNAPPRAKIVLIYVSQQSWVALVVVLLTCCSSSLDRVVSHACQAKALCEQSIEYHQKQSFVFVVVYGGVFFFW